MGDRLNQYQRRQAKRRIDKSMAQAFLSTVLLFGIGYLLFHDTFMRSVYQQVLDSNGRLNVDAVQVADASNYVIPFLIVWVVLSAFLTLRASSRHSSFEFDDPGLGASGERRGKPINLHRLSPRQFEEVVAQMIARQGYRTRVVGGARDGGVDIKVFSRQGQLVGVVQCKRYKPNKALTPGFVREMATVRQMHGVNIAYLATTAYFTEESKRLAQQLNVRLIDGHDLKQIVKGVSSSPTEQPAPQVAAPMPLPLLPPPQDQSTQFRPPPAAISEQEHIEEQLRQRRERLKGRSSL